MPTLTLSTTWPLALLAALPIVWLLAWRNRASVARARVAAAAVLRSLALAAIVAALARPVLHRSSEEVSVVYALDVSGSVSRRFVDEALEWIAQVDVALPAGTVALRGVRGDAELVESVEAARALGLPAADGAERPGTIDAGATDLEEALLATLPGFAPGPGQAHRAAERRQPDRRRRLAGDAAPAGRRRAGVRHSRGRSGRRRCMGRADRASPTACASERRWRSKHGCSRAGPFPRGSSSPRRTRGCRAQRDALARGEPRFLYRALPARRRADVRAG